MFYADTSALVKLAVRETETPALVAWIRAEQVELATSDLARTELVRAVRRAAPASLAAARDVLSRIVLLRASADIFDQASRLEPSELRSLDAVHLASALALGDELEGIVVYDERLAGAAAALGIAVIAPGE